MGAKIEARRFAVMQKYLKESEDSPDNALLGPGSYLAGYVFEQAGNADEALRYYDEALAGHEFATLAPVIRRLAERSGYRSPKITELLEAGPEADADSDESYADVMVVLNYGRVPALIDLRLPVGLAITYSAARLSPTMNQQARRAAGQGLVTWVNIPALGPR